MTKTKLLSDSLDGECEEERKDVYEKRYVMTGSGRRHRSFWFLSLDEINSASEASIIDAATENTQNLDLSFPTSLHVDRIACSHTFPLHILTKPPVWVWLKRMR